MTYIHGGTEYLDDEERQVMLAVIKLRNAGRTVNNSQLSNATGLSRTRIGQVTTTLQARGYLRDVSKGAAYHWRVTSKPVPVQSANAIWSSPAHGRGAWPDPVTGAYVMPWERQAWIEAA